MTQTYTRKQYLNEEVDHDTYYRQFGLYMVDYLEGNPHTLEPILEAKSVDALGASYWGGYNFTIQHTKQGKAVIQLHKQLAGHPPTLAEVTCIMKAAGRLLRERYESKD